ncbi:MAG: pyridoxamine kinase [Eubacteriales bacterium]|nr:pyridoxamine kinase [Eubacteriales bacterium]
MKKAIIINDLSGMGKCSLTAAIPVISVMGVQAIPLPTAVLSNQTDYDSYYCVDLTEHIDEYVSEWKKRGLHPDGIYTGFFTNAKQAEVFLKFIDAFSDEHTFLLTDPVMGDQGDVYDIYTDELLERMRKLAHRAHVITPNLTEALLLLYGKDEMLKQWQKFQNEKEVRKLGRRITEAFDLEGVVITGLDLKDQNSQSMIGTLVCEKKHGSNKTKSEQSAMNEKTVQYETRMETSPKIGGSYSGTGDIFASVICAGMLRNLSLNQCVRRAMNLIEKSLKMTEKEHTDRNDGICFEQYLFELAEGLK